MKSLQLGLTPGPRSQVPFALNIRDCTPWLPDHLLAGRFEALRIPCPHCVIRKEVWQRCVINETSRQPKNLPLIAAQGMILLLHAVGTEGKTSISYLSARSSLFNLSFVHSLISVPFHMSEGTSPSYPGLLRAARLLVRQILC